MAPPIGASTVEASPLLPTVDDLEYKRTQYVLINDIVPDVVTQRKLRAYAVQRRSVSALEPAPFTHARGRTRFGFGMLPRAQPTLLHPRAPPSSSSVSVSAHARAIYTSDLSITAKIRGPLLQAGSTAAALASSSSRRSDPSSNANSKWTSSRADTTHGRRAEEIWLMALRLPGWGVRTRSAWLRLQPTNRPARTGHRHGTRSVRNDSGLPGHAPPPLHIRH
ncbi:hypothetical protein B0H19DRAFT_161272 [Mycena capillaripes]|nr:hypothetical protein B0H19DRAFT_161272 [Mycena capillaripes]